MARQTKAVHGFSPAMPRTVCFSLRKGLTRSVALRYAVKAGRRRGKLDYRGFKYNPTTGEAWLT